MKKATATATAKPATAATAATAAPTAPKFTPSPEGVHAFATLAKAFAAVEKASKEANVSLIRAMWGFSPAVPFTTQWEALAPESQKVVAMEARGALSAACPKLSKAAIGAACRAAGFRLRAERSDKDALSQARAFLKAGIRAYRKALPEAEIEELGEFFDDLVNEVWAGEAE